MFCIFIMRVVLKHEGVKLVLCKKKTVVTCQASVCYSALAVSSSLQHGILPGAHKKIFAYVILTQPPLIQPSSSPVT